MSALTRRYTAATTTTTTTAGYVGYAQQARQLGVFTRRLRDALAGINSSTSTGTSRSKGKKRSSENNEVDRVVYTAWAVYAGIQDAAMELVRTLALGMSSAHGGGGGGGVSGRVVEETRGKLERLLLFDGGDDKEQEGQRDDEREAVDELGDVLSGLKISDSGGDGGMGLEYFEAVRAWGLAVWRLRKVLYYRGWDHRGMMEEKEDDNGNHINKGVTRERTRAAAPSLVSMMGRRWEARWQNREALDRTLGEIRRLMARMREGIGDVRERVIAVRGDVVLEFSSVDAAAEEEEDEQSDDVHEEEEEDDDEGQEIMSTPVLLRFRVSSAMLAETSPFFARLFATTTPSPSPSPSPPRGSSGAGFAGEKNGQTAAAPAALVRPVYRVPGRRETDAHDALTILLCAAHMQHDRVPEQVRFEQLVAIAEVCLRYECTTPVEMFVAHLWLPAWIHKAAAPPPPAPPATTATAADDDDDGLVLVSYVFGLRRLFARVSKTAVLGIVDEEALRGKTGWPTKVKDRIWAVRNAKVAQVYAACSSAVQEYLGPASERRGELGAEAAAVPPPLRPVTDTQARSQYHRNSLPPASIQRQGTSSAFALTTTPRCPKGSHACDAANLGWLLLVLNELQLLHTVMGPSVFSSQPAHQARRSLAQLLDILRSIPSPTSPVHHSGVCDPALTLRSAVNDVYNSVTGLTLFEVDGKRHGWALSKNKAREVQSVSNIPLGKFSEVETVHTSRLEEDVDMDEPAGKDKDGSEDVVVLQQNPSQTHKAATERPPFVAFQPDEATCLRILSFLDASDDLYAAAMTNRTFYAAFQRNELMLMRRLVRANRRLTLSVLVGKDGGLFAAQDHKQEPTPVYEPDHEHVMTEEEACRILWPDENPLVGGGGGGNMDGLNDGWEHVSNDDARKTQIGESRGEKVLVDREIKAEEKTLVVMGDKSLLEQLDRRKGIASD